jgi:SAM-dependent methyltransferase
MAAAASARDGNESDGSFADWEEEDSSDVLISALTGSVVKDMNEWWQELTDATGFDFAAFITEKSLDYHGKVRLVNLCRSSIARALSKGDHEVALTALDASETWESEELLVPVMKDDAVLRHLEDEDWSDDDEGAAGTTKKQTTAPGSGPASGAEDMVHVPRHKLEALQRAAAMGHRLVSEDDDADAAGAQSTSEPAPVAVAGLTASGPHSKLTTGSRGGGVSEEGYFGGYADSGIHVEMLQDVSRTSAYKTAIERAVAALGRGCSFVDVGAGTGILSLLAARAGALASAIEASPLAHHATATAVKNGLSTAVPVPDAPDRGTVQVLHKRAETVTVEDLPGAKQCDAIVSEWMGYALLFEDMLPAVIRARDSLLRPGGMLLPDRATIYVAAVSDRRLWRRTAGFWKNAWGFDMSHMQPEGRVMDVRDVHPASLASDTVAMADLDLLTCNETSDLEPAADLVLRLADEPSAEVRAVLNGPVAEAGESAEGFVGASERCLHGLVLWFTTAFEGRGFGVSPAAGAADASSRVEPVVLDTSPHARSTHWKQGVFWFDEPVPVSAVCAEDGTMRCSLKLSRAATNRCYEAKLVLQNAEATGSAVDGIWAIE